MYISNKAEHFTYKSGCSIHVSRSLKEEMVWVIDKWFQVISIALLLKAIIATSKELKFSALKYAVLRYVVLSNYVVGFNSPYVLCNCLLSYVALVLFNIESLHYKLTHGM